MDKIARVRQEIERRLNILTNVYDEQMERKDEEMMTYYHGKVIALEELLSFLDTLSEEPDTPEFPETFEICLYDGRTPNKENCNECSTTCSVRKEEPDKSLEKFVVDRELIKAAEFCYNYGTTSFPDKSLEEEIETWIPAHISVGTDETLPVNPTELANTCKEWGKGIARHFYELGKNSK